MFCDNDAIILRRIDHFNVQDAKSKLYQNDYSVLRAGR